MEAVASFDRISLTAKFVAYLRTLSDIRYSGQIALCCGAREAFNQIMGKVSDARPEDFFWMAPGVELRYKSVDAVLENHSFTNIVELAAGVSPRGLIWSRGGGITYLETDLPGILSEKKQIVSQILGNVPRAKLNFLAVEATNRQQFTAMEGLLEDGPAAILCEGLLPYLGRKEVGQVVANVYELLKSRGGIWITPDIFSGDRLKKILEIDPKVEEVMKAISEHTGRDFKANSFVSLESAERFYRDFGFKVDSYKQRELVPHLTSLERVDVDEAKVKVMCDDAQIWTMEIS